MVLFFSSIALDPPVTIYMGKDKYENEDLIKYAWPQDVWFHVDKLSSAHVYLRLPNSIADWTSIPEKVLTECAQLVKANSIEGNKKDNLTILYTPASNLKKTGDMAVGQVSFKSEKLVKRVYVQKRENPIVNRLNKTKVEREVDHEQERIDRMKKEKAESRARLTQQRKEEEELAKKRAEDKAARDYALLDVSFFFSQKA
ncbi:cytoplasmic [Pyrrhoderma noxium]|uniref:Cytoplasmic n=1 Tax=Pyrrhoderma noxium TaxID=2282107 RepID=A0A286UBA9_9AGAM|nr:cytoplasmic [Pyrrhoderma noxium]